MATAPKHKPAVVNVHESKTHFSKLLERVARGETITIAKANRPVARLGPLPVPRRWGAAKGLIWMSEDFDAPMPEFEADFCGESKPSF